MGAGVEHQGCKTGGDFPLEDLLTLTCSPCTAGIEGGPSIRSRFFPGYIWMATVVKSPVGHQESLVATCL
jgi:hypothetical protein